MVRMTFKIMRSKYLQGQLHMPEWIAVLPKPVESLRIKSCSALNRDFAEWGEAFANQLLGAATLDRLRHGAYRVVLDGESYRTPRPLPKSAKTAASSRGGSDQAHQGLSSPVAGDG